MTGAIVLRGPLIRFTGDPFVDGTSALTFESDGALVMQHGLISDVGPAARVLSAHPEAQVRNTGTGIIAPGFVDCHTHYPQIGVIGSWGARLLDWLETYTFPEEARFGDPDHARTAARAFFDEQLRNGITTSASFCTIHPTSVNAYFAEAEARGLRCIGGKVMMDRNAPPELCDTPQTAFDDANALIARWHRRGRAGYAVTPRFAPTSTPEQLEAAGALWAANPDCLMQTHLSEQSAEIDWVARLFPGSGDYLGVYERFGLVGAGAVFGHAIHLTPHEAARLSASGSGVAHCPTSNQYLGSGECDVLGLVSAGAPLGLATDTGGGSSYAMFDTMKAAYEVAQRRGDTLSPAQLWWLATCGAARALKLESHVGNLVAGLEADAIVIDPAATPVLAQRTIRAQSIAEVMFALIVLADDRAVTECWSGGVRVRPK